MNRLTVVGRNMGRGGTLRVALCAAALFVASFVSIATARSEDMLIDLQFGGSTSIAYSGAIMIGSDSDYINLRRDPDVIKASLQSSSGASTGVTVSYTSQGVGVAPDQPGAFGFYGTSYADLMQGYIYAYDGVARDITFEGLAASSAYSIYVYTQGDSAATDRQLTITTNGTTYTSLPSVATASTFVENQNYLALTGISDAQGVLTLTYNFAAGEANINAIQIQGPAAVPEPSTSLLLGVAVVAGLGLLRRRRIA